MDKKFAIYIVVGLLIGALFGNAMRPDIHNPLLATGSGALAGAFIGWFIAAAMQQKEKER